MPDTMTEEQDLQLAEEARQEREASKTADKDKKPYEKAMEEDHPELVEEKVEEKPEEKPEIQKEEPVIEPVEIKPEEKSNDEVQQWAVKHNLTPEQAKEDLDKTKSIVDKYKSPEEMAKALRLIQSERDILKNETLKKKEQPVITAVPKDPRIEINTYVANNAEKLIKDYKTRFPNKSALMEDEVILEEMADQIHNNYLGWESQQRDTVKKNASAKRDDVLTNISQEDKQFLPQIKPVLMEMSDEQVLAPDFSVNELINWAKGKNIDKLIKEAEERGYKKAKAEGSKILGQLPDTKIESKTTVKTPVNKSSALSSYEKERALEMYDGTNMTEEEKYTAFAEARDSVKPKEKKK